MAKTAKKTMSKAEKYDRQKALNAERVRRHRQKMSAENLEKKRQYDRDRYKKHKEQGLIKMVGELKSRDQRIKRKNWRKYSRKHRAKTRSENEVFETIPLESEVDVPNPPIVPAENKASSSKKILGRKTVRRDRAKAYKKIKQQTKKILDLERRLKKYQKRLEREKKKKKSLVSPSPNAKVSQLVGKEKVSPAVRKRLFVGYALEKQLQSQVKSHSSKSTARQNTYKAIGSDILRKYRVQKYLIKIINYKANKMLKESTSLEYKKKKYNSKIVSVANNLRAFFEDDSVSRMCPGKKDVKRCGKIKKQKRILLDSMKNLYKRYIKETLLHISYTTFTRARPFWVVHPTAKDRDTCACKTHSNIELMVTALKSINAIDEKNYREILNKTVCSTESELCMMEQCENCKHKNIKFKPLNDVNIKVHQWKTVTEKKVIKGVERKVTKTIKAKEVTDLKDLEKRFIGMLSKFKKHVFAWVHQSKHKKHIRDNLKENDIMFQIDFSENYNTKYAKEIQSMHFGASKRQISLHTGIRYHYENGKIECKGFCSVSDCLDHQSHGVWAHFQPILKDTGKLFPLTQRVHIFSDSPSSQYRNRGNIFLFKSILPTYFPALKTATWNFSEPGHGKGPMDGIGGTLKRRADEYVLHCKDLTCAKEFVDAFQQSKVMVVEVPPKQMDVMKKKLNVDIPPILNITKMKQITFSKDNPMRGRTLSCTICPENNKCTHYAIGNPIFPKPINVKRKLFVHEVFTDSSDEDTPLGKRIQSYDDPRSSIAGPSSSEDKRIITTSDDVKPGEFVLVRFTSKKAVQQYAGICRSCVKDDEGFVKELEVVFLKSTSPDKQTYMLNEKDVSFVLMDQIVDTLPPPTMVQRGSRTYYRFKRPIATY